MKIAIFFSDFSLDLSLHVTDLVNSLAKRGFKIDLFVYRCGDIIPRLHKNVNLIILREDSISQIKPVDRIKAVFRKSSIGKSDFISEAAENTINHYFRKNIYDYCLAIEKRSLVFLEISRKIIKIPFAYQSLELYDRKSPGIWTNKQMAFLFKLENSMLGKCDRFIIQDKTREKIFYTDRKVRFHPKTFYLPVSINRRDVKKSKYWHRKYKLSAETKIVLSIGQIDQDRLVYEAVEAAQKFPKIYKLILHGPVSKIIHDELIKLDKKKKVIVSSDLVRNNSLFRFSAASDVGLVFYTAANANQITAGKSSHKMAIHALTGTPVISLNYLSFKSVIDKFHCGICIKNIGEIKHAVDIILSKYKYYEKGAKDAFDNVYCLDKYMDNLSDQFFNKKAGFMKE